MLLDGTYFWILNLFLLAFIINSVYTGGRSGEHVHIKLHIPEVYKKHTHVQTIVKHHFHPPPPSPKQKKVHHYHHHHHSHKSKSKTNSHFHFENVPVHSSHSHHYEIPTYKPKKLSSPSPMYSTEYHYGGGYKPMKSATLKYSGESFRPSIPLYSVDEEDEHHMPEYNFNSDTHEDIMEEPENEYDETRTTPYYTAPLSDQQPLHTSFQSSSLVNDEDNNSGGASQWDGLLSKKYKFNDIKLEAPHSTTWPLSMPSELEPYSTISQYTKPKKGSTFVYDSDNFELGYTNSDFSAALGSGSSAKINKKWPSLYSTRLIANSNYDD